MDNNNKIFNDIFDSEPTNSSFAHSRVNLIGEHTDYTGGYVLPCLLPYKTSVIIAKNNNSNNYCAYSDFFQEKCSFNDFIKSTSNEWIDYIKGCLFVFYNENKKLKNIPLNILIRSDIPIGRGISSSSAMCVATLKSLNSFFNIGYNEKHIAILAQKVERDYIGVSGGIMDQMISSIGVNGKAFFLDCLTLKYELLNIPNNWIFYLVDSEVQRNLRDSSYNDRFNQLKKAEKILDVDYLGSVKIKSLKKEHFKDQTIYKRAHHVITENQRVLEAKTFMIDNNIKKFGELMNLSHASYSKDFEASTKDVDLLVQRSIDCGAIGCRLTGGGFGGFTVSLIEKKEYVHWYNKMTNHYSTDKFFKV